MKGKYLQFVFMIASVNYWRNCANLNEIWCLAWVGIHFMTSKTYKIFVYWITFSACIGPARDFPGSITLRVSHSYCAFCCCGNLKCSPDEQGFFLSCALGDGAREGRQAQQTDPGLRPLTKRFTFWINNWHLVSGILSYVTCQPPQTCHLWDLAALSYWGPKLSFGKGFSVMGPLGSGSQPSPAGSRSHCKGPFQPCDSGVWQLSENCPNCITLFSPGNRRGQTSKDM